MPRAPRAPTLALSLRQRSESHITSGLQLPLLGIKDGEYCLLLSYQCFVIIKTNIFGHNNKKMCIVRAPNTLSTATTYVSVTLKTATRNSATITTSAAVKISAAITTYARTQFRNG
ncbi:hypothetical protein J6590_042662 [Homalodisca vitripennis]|nr:hypothetical protein J6590_042662 [Homalodisca vitripennis]